MEQAATTAATESSHGVPDDPATRTALRDALQRYAREQQLRPPLPMSELRRHVRTVLAAAEFAADWEGFAAVLLHNAVWERRLAAIPPTRRLLLLPRCLRHRDDCEGEMDEIGLLCARCGRCPLPDLQTEAEALGYTVLIAEGTPIVVSLLRAGEVDGIIGVSCLAMLEEVFPLLEAAAVPALAVPLLRDGCVDTAVDLEWVRAAIRLRSGHDSPVLDLDALRAAVRESFTAELIAATMGQPVDETARIGQDWLARSGKRWRPFLAACAWHCYAAAEQPLLTEDFRRVAIGVECFHKASLIHDDIEDDDDRRYGEPTVHCRYGVPVALNTGDFILGEGYRLIGSCEATATRRLRLLQVAADGHRTLALGQGAELCWARRPRPLSVAEVIDIFRRKTAPAFAVALQIGALYGGAPDADCQVLAAYSEALGVAYQIRDDLDDFRVGGDSDDLAAGRPSLILALAHEHSEGADREALIAAWESRPNAPDRGAVDAICRRLGVEAEALAMLEAFEREAIQTLRGLANDRLRDILRRVIGRIFGPLREEPASDSAPSPSSDAAARRRGAD